MNLALEMAKRAMELHAILNSHSDKKVLECENVIAAARDLFLQMGGWEIKDSKLVLKSQNT